MKVFFLMFLQLYYLKSVISMFCYWNTGCPYKYFASKTPYNMLRGDIRDSVVKLTGCEPVSIWAIMRHGKNNPCMNFAKDMKEAKIIKDYVISGYNNGNSTLCAQDVDHLRDWIADEDIFGNVNQLSKEGYLELVGIGQRLRIAFPKLLNEISKDEYTFRAVKEKWIEDSMKGFMEGIGNKRLQIDLSLDGYDNIAPHKKCEKYTKGVRKSNATYLEAEKYRNELEFLASKDRLQRRLGIPHPLSDANVIAMWNFCRFTSSGIQNKFSQWCGLFTYEDLKVLEYLEDLKRYYKNSYGTPMNKLFGEIVLSDLLKKFEEAKINGKKITTYITDSTTMDMVYTALGLFKDKKHLTGMERKSDRKWRTSKLSIFANNLIAVLNRCGIKQDDNNYNVVFYLNEEPIQTLCNGGVCRWKEFENMLSPFLNANMDICTSE